MDRLRADPTCLPVELVDELEVRSVAVLEALVEALSGPPDPSAPHFRAAVRELSFVGGWLAGRGASASLAVRYLLELGEVLWTRLGADVPVAWRTLERALAALVMETYCRSLRADAGGRLQSLLEKCTPLVRLPGNRPALLLVGSPSREVLSALSGRLLLEAVRTGAERVVVDFAGCTGLADRALEVLVDLARHRQMRDRALVITGAPDEVRRPLRRALQDGPRVTFLEAWDEQFD